jgi:hypothetical protein
MAFKLVESADRWRAVKVSHLVALVPGSACLRTPKATSSAWTISIDSSIVWAHQHAAGTRKRLY